MNRTRNRKLSMISLLALVALTVGTSLILLQRAHAHTLPAERVLHLTTTFKCVQDEAPQYTTCVFQNLLVIAGKSYCVDATGKQSSIKISLERPVAYAKDRETSFKCTFVTPRQALQKLKAAGVKQVELYKYGMVMYRRNFSNFYHILMETMTNWHYRFCKNLGLCEYNANVAKQTQLVILDDGNEYPASLMEAQNCLGQTWQVSVDRETPTKASIIQSAVVGQDRACFTVGSCGKKYTGWETRPMVDLDYLVKWRTFLQTCMGLDPKASAKDERRKKKIVIIQRLLEAHRTILNMPEVMRNIKAQMPGYDISVAFLEDASLQKTAQLLHSAGIVLRYHGASNANLIFTPLDAAHIEIRPYGVPHELFYDYTSYYYSRAWNLYSQQYKVEAQHDIFYNWEYIFKDVAWQTASMQEKLAFLEKGRCPSTHKSGCHVWWSEWKAHGAILRWEERLKPQLMNCTKWLNTPATVPAYEWQAS